MILRRLSQSLKQQNWTAIWIEFILLVSGVFLGIQVSNWNADRVDRIRANANLQRIGADLDADIANYKDRMRFWGDVSMYGAKGLAYAETGDARGSTQWDLLLAYFQSSQVAEFYTTDSTFEELKSAGDLGLITDTDFRDALAQYYALGFNPLLTERPRYREHVRGIIPLATQKYIWTHCYSSDAKGGQRMLACKSPMDEVRATEIVDSIRKDPTIATELRYWMSSMHVATLFAKGRMQGATELRSTVNSKLEDIANDAP